MSGQRDQKPSIRLRALQGGVLFINRRMRKKQSTIENGRAALSKVEGMMRVATGVTETVDEIAGVPVRRYSTPSPKKGTILYIHGGAYVGGSSMSGRAYSRIVAESGRDMVSVDYRLAPEHPFPAGVDDALAVYLALGDQPVVIMGDSAGGGLTLSLTQRIRDEGVRMPVGIIPIFPWADLTQSGASYPLNAGRDVLSKAGLDENAAQYAGGADVTLPGISPVFGSFVGFPPALIPVGTHDSLLEDARAVAAAMQRDGAQVTLREVPGAVHGFVILPVPEVRATIDAMRDFVSERFALVRA